MYLAFRSSDGFNPHDIESEFIDSVSHLFSLRGQNIDVYEHFDEGNFRAELLSKDIENSYVPGKYAHLDSPVLILPYFVYCNHDIYGEAERAGITASVSSPILVTSMNFAKALILHGCIGYETDWEGRPSSDIFSGGRISINSPELMLPLGNLKFDEQIDLAKVGDYIESVWLDKTRFDCYGDAWLEDKTHTWTWFPTEDNHRRAKEDFSWRMNALKNRPESEQKQVREALEKATEKWNKFLLQCIRNGTIMVNY